MIRFVVTSALNTEHGIYPFEQRLAQQKETYRSIRNHFPNAAITTVEASPVAIDLDTVREIMEVSDSLITYSHEPYLQDCYRRWNHEAIKKNLGETWIMHRLLSSEDFHHDADDSIVKISGRYRLRDDFQLNVKPGMITLAGPSPTGNPESMSDIRYWYSCRCIQWSNDIHYDMVSYYEAMHQIIRDHVTAGKYTDTEHALYHCIPKEIINNTFPGSVGIEGELAPNGETVRD
jgi:hypothetical protein